MSACLEKCMFRGLPHDECYDPRSVPANVPLAFVTRDSGERHEYDSGMVRDTRAGKPRFDLLVPKGIPFSEQMLTRWAGLLARGAEKYGDRNWEKADGLAELERAQDSAFRHFMQWLCGEEDEDHGAAVLFNITEVEFIRSKMRSAAQ